jgi:hypothetical protein
MSSKKILRNALYAYMLLAPIIAIYILFFVKIDFLLQIICVALVGAGLIVLGVLNLWAK